MVLNGRGSITLQYFYTRVECNKWHVRPENFSLHDFQINSYTVATQDILLYIKLAL